MQKFLKQIGYTAEIDYYDRLLYFLNLCAVLVAGMFLCIYIFFIPFYPAIIAHIIYLFCSLALYLLLKYKKFDFVRYAIVLLHMIQLTLAVFLWFPVETGFNLYYFMVPMTAFTIMRYRKVYQRLFAVGASLAASFLYLISEILPLDDYLYQTSDNINYLLRGGTIVTILIPMIYIFTMLARRDYIVHQELKNLAERDSLTRIFNRRVLYKSGNDAFRKARNSNSIYSILLFDVDFFKRVNDQYGHPAGDALLKELAELVSENIRKTDLFARYGGEEFAVLLHHTDEAEGLAVAEKLLQIIRSHVFEIEKHLLQVTISMGIVEYSADFNNFDEMMKAADQRLYAAKKNGRNQIRAGKDRNAGL